MGSGSGRLVERCGGHLQPAHGCFPLRADPAPGPGRRPLSAPPTTSWRLNRLRVRRLPRHRRLRPHLRLLVHEVFVSTACSSTSTTSSSTSFSTALTGGVCAVDHVHPRSSSLRTRLFGGDSISSSATFLPKHTSLLSDWFDTHNSL